MRENKQKLSKPPEPPKQEDPKKDPVPTNEQLRPNQKRNKELWNNIADIAEAIMKMTLLYSIAQQASSD